MPNFTFPFSRVCHAAPLLLPTPYRPSLFLHILSRVRRLIKTCRSTTPSVFYASQTPAIPLVCFPDCGRKVKCSVLSTGEHTVWTFLRLVWVWGSMLIILDWRETALDCMSPHLFKKSASAMQHFWSSWRVPLHGRIHVPWFHVQILCNSGGGIWCSHKSAHGN